MRSVGMDWNACSERAATFVVVAICASIFTSMSAQSQAGPQIDVSHCAVIAADDDRLKCYDSAFVVRAEPALDSAWSVTVDKSPLDDSTKVIARVQSSEPLAGRFARQRATFIVRCENNRTNAFIVFGGNFMSDLNNGGRVDLRVDDRRATYVTMRVSNDNQALGLWDGPAAIRFVQRILDGQSMYFQATPFSESRVFGTFPIAGMDEALQPLRDACSW